MQFITKYVNLLLSIFIILLSSAALLYNYYVTEYPGNNYFLPQANGIAFILFLMLIGCYLTFDKGSPYVKQMLELVYFYLIMTLIALATNAVQYTPFTPIDKQLIAMDSFFGIHLEKIVSWIVDRSWLRIILVKIYDSLPYQMTYVPLILIFARKYFYIREYYSYLLITVIIGFVFYYFCPTVAPATAIGHPIFSTAEYDTGLKFQQIHNHIQPTTIEGGLVAMPSFHVIWAILCVNALRCWPIIFALLLPVNLLLIASCVLLGWHYFVDLLGSLFVLSLAFFIVKLANFPRNT